MWDAFNHTPNRKVEMLKITSDVLKEWGACEEGFRWFKKLFPDGAELKTVADALADDGHVDWVFWLYGHCRKDDRFRDQATDGFQNAGNGNTGHQNTGHRNAGHRNTGHQNTRHWNTGNGNTGNQNTGNRNTGNWNTGHCNTGHRNAGNWNTGHQNTGDWNTGHRNTGSFNTVTPDEILVFNRPLLRVDWDSARKPLFIYNIETTWWVDESSMTDEEKAADPDFYMRGGQLRTRTYREAWRKAWDWTTETDRRLILSLPNFDPDVFLEISGIDVRREFNDEAK